jgi:hypothetical protein
VLQSLAEWAPARWLHAGYTIAKSLESFLDRHLPID